LSIAVVELAIVFHFNTASTENENVTAESWA